MKRKADGDALAGRSLKRQEQTAPQRGGPRPLGSKSNEPRLLDAASVRQQAQSYRLATAKLPLDALTCRWKNGSNRHVNRQHVSRLCRIFKQGALARQAEENFLLVQCSAEMVRRMRDHVDAQGSGGGQGEVLSFDDWSAVNGGEKVEVMAGQHRMEALREYVEQTGSDAKELWWTCILYDRGR